MDTFLFACAGYIIGSIPVAYLLARKQFGIDLRHNGSHNIGARNAYESTGNKRLGITVLILDMHKGIIPLLLLDKLGYCSMTPIIAATIILGHCYPIWLKFHGGRGLATGAAIMLLTSPDILLCWLIVYGVSGFLKKNVHFQSLAATVGCAVFELLVYPSSLFFHFHFVCKGDPLAFHYSTLGMLMIILSRHIQPVIALFRKTQA
ncbi:MAG: glycerol-3-phosphate acyltransferase [Bacteroidota bacterium]|nr:glycerol-3-phosphate acyltransferase [Bacteroidota bacterium]MDP4230231.1 glycerol-3-phosphate acyltransferase [Bacteroidota bacterium]MDP4236503.1 glycerol-3-phosphate acyltransferase [Bacteroidota bacterium]